MIRRLKVVLPPGCRYCADCGGYGELVVGADDAGVTVPCSVCRGSGYIVVNKVDYVESAKWMFKSKRRGSVGRK